MAYLCIIASVPPDKVQQIRLPADVSRLASRVAFASHYIVPASAEIREAMDGGVPLDTDTWHPLRGFMFHEPSAVQRQAACLSEFSARMSTTGHPLQADEWTRGEIEKVVHLFQHASSAGESVVTALDRTRTGKR